MISWRFCGLIDQTYIARVRGNIGAKDVERASHIIVVCFPEQHVKLRCLGKRLKLTRGQNFNFILPSHVFRILQAQAPRLKTVVNDFRLFIQRTLGHNNITIEPAPLSLVCVEAQNPESIPIMIHV